MLPDVYYESRSLIKGQNMYIWVDSEVLDFTVSKAYVLKISTDTYSVSLPFDERNVKEFFSFFNDLSQYNPIVFGWNYKILNSYFLAKVGKRLEFTKVYDLKIIESFHGVNKAKPQDFNEAKTRLASTPNFNKFKKLWQEIYLPLVDEVIPTIENTPLTDKNKKKLVYPCYEIEGQINGRMKCIGGYSMGYNPHAMTPQVKDNLNPPGYEDNFLYFDYKSMEVFVLQWLSKDMGLKEIVERDKDVYESIWEKITGVPCDENRRNLCKSLFLPVVFGQGWKTTAENLKVSENTAKKLIDNIYNSFPDALAYVNQKPSNDQIVDYFGRIRRLEEQNFRARNFLVQSPAAVICLHKLVNLYKKIKNNARICYHLHDGFCILVNNQNLKHVMALGKEVLTEQSDLYPNIKLKTSVKIGKKLIEI